MRTQCSVSFISAALRGGGPGREVQVRKEVRASALRARAAFQPALHWIETFPFLPCRPPHHTINRQAQATSHCDPVSDILDREENKWGGGTAVNRVSPKPPLQERELQAARVKSLHFCSLQRRNSILFFNSLKHPLSQIAHG